MRTVPRTTKRRLMGASVTQLAQNRRDGSIGVQPSTTVWTGEFAPLPPKSTRSTRGRPATRLRRAAGHKPVSVKNLASQLPRRAWRTVGWRDGSNTRLMPRFAALRVRAAHQDWRRSELREEEWLVIGPQSKSEPVHYGLSNLPANTALRTLVSTAMTRWRIERDYGAQPWHACREIYRRGVELGFTRLLLPEAYGGIGRKLIDAAVVFEELGAADVRIAADYFALTATVPLAIAAAGTAEQKRSWLGELTSRSPLLLAGALSEPRVAGSELFCPAPDPKLGIRTFARREGEAYVLDGQKSAFIMNGAIADRYLILCRTSLEVPQARAIFMFYVPADTPGLRAGPRTRMIGAHTSHHVCQLPQSPGVPIANSVHELELHPGAGLRRLQPQSRSVGRSLEVPAAHRPALVPVAVPASASATG
jgi:alkylation response protein AidB-like acyl-CoA dehydrogenase